MVGNTNSQIIGICDTKFENKYYVGLWKFDLSSRVAAIPVLKYWGMNKICMFADDITNAFFRKKNLFVSSLKPLKYEFLIQMLNCVND